jgi:membrane-bound acyltransferase YfiQ involved in biofilm formation
MLIFYEPRHFVRDVLRYFMCRQTVNIGLSTERPCTAGARAVMRLPREFSTFLDLIRFSAAVIVFLGHLSDSRFGGEVLRPFLPLAKSAVIAFFVLSEYVVSWSATRERTATDFAVNRVARIYSVRCERCF